MKPLLGLFLIVGFFSLTQSMQGMAVHYYGPLGFESGGELNLWLGYVLFLFPGLFLVCDYLIRDRAILIEKSLDGISEKLKSLSSRDWIILVSLLSVYIFLIACLGNDLVLLGFPFTDDEFAARLGGQILAQGKLMEPVREPLMAFIHPFMYIRNGFYTSLELPGIAAVWALGILAGRESLFWSLSAALPIIPIMIIVRRNLSRSWAFAAGLLYLFYAQAATLSITTHSHLLSRAIVAWGLLAFELGREKGQEKKLFYLSFLTAVSLLCRPYEALSILFPVYIALLFKVWKKQLDAKRTVSFLVLGAIVPLVCFFGYNHFTTGDALVFTRWHPAYQNYDLPAYGEAVKEQLTSAHSVVEWIETLWRRMGGNLINNFMGIDIWFYAPLGLWVALYAVRLNFLTQVLGGGIFFNLLIMLFNDSYGIHSVGPINFSELSSTLLLLLVFGLNDLWISSVRQSDLLKRRFFSAITASVIASVVFIFFNWSALHRQAEIHATVYNFVEDSIEALRAQNPQWVRGTGKAAVLSDRYIQYWYTDPKNKAIGSYVYEWRIPSPKLTEKTIFIRDDAKLLEQELKALPDRDFFRLIPLATAPYMKLVWLNVRN